MGKARLAPIKADTIPRVELTAATVSIRVGELLKREVDGEPEFMYHTDSETVLRYIANEQQRFHVFVVNRVQLIRDHSHLNQWRYVDTKENPADDASRGLDGLALLEGLKVQVSCGNPRASGCNNHSHWAKSRVMTQM